MKREIICVNCAIEQRELFPTDNPYPGEYVKFIEGAALEDYVCDLCSNTIEHTDKCYAFSIYTDRQPYWAWEHEFIKIATIKICINCGKPINTAYSRSNQCAECDEKGE